MQGKGGKWFKSALSMLQRTINLVLLILTDAFLGPYQQWTNEQNTNMFL